MKFQPTILSFAVALIVLTVAVSGCDKPTETDGNKASGAAGTPHEEHGDHKDGDHKDGDHETKAFTDADIKMPGTFADGIARLEELNQTIEHHIEGNLLSDVHHVAEEMALIARKMKEYARTSLKVDQQTEAGRLCNEIAGFYPSIDEAADAGKKPETTAIHKQMTDSIAKLKALQK